jgi:hypothetical protein
MAKKKTNNSGFDIFYGIVLAILLFGLLNLGVYVFYPSPEYTNYCTYDKIGATNIESCELNNGIWNNSSSSPYCDYTQCSNEYQESLDSYNMKAFYIYVILGALLAIIGLFITNNIFQITIFSSGTAFLIEGIIRNINNKIPAFIAAAVAFILISIIIYRKTKRK